MVIETERRIRITEDTTYHHLLDELDKASQQVGITSVVGGTKFESAELGYMKAVYNMDVFLEYDRSRAIEEAYQFGKVEGKGVS